MKKAKMMARAAGISVSALYTRLRRWGLVTRCKSEERPYQDAAWLREQRASKTCAQIAKECGVSIHTIHMWSRAASQKEQKSIPLWRNREWLEEQCRTKTATQIAKECGISLTAILNWKRRFGLNRRDRSKEIARLHAEGVPAREIAARLGVTRQAIYQKLKRMRDNAQDGGN